jgi:Putative DNA-binding domain
VKNPLTEPLEAFTFEQIVESLDAISEETGRLDFKEEMIARTELAYRACSFANSEGGLIIIGIKDPIQGQPLAFGPLPKTDDKERLRILAQINSRTYPALPLDVFGYRSVDGSKALMVIRIARSDAAPHEFTGSDQKHNLPVRRGTMTDRLSLAEIEVLRLRRSGIANESPLRPKMMPHVSIQPMGDSGFVGLSVTPIVYSTKRRVMDLVDDHLCFSIAEVTRGPADAIHGELEMKGMADSNWLYTKGWVPHQGSVASSGYGPDYLGPAASFQVFSDGDIIIRNSQTDEDVFKQFIYVLLMGYAAAQEIFFNFGLRPEARFHVISRFDKRRGASPSSMPEAYEDWFDLNLSTDAFSDSFVDTIMRLSRSGDRSSKREIMRDILTGYSREVLPLGDDLRPRWMGSP